MSFEEILKKINQTAQTTIATDSTDYVKDGLLYCGRCNTPKQCVVTILGKEHTPLCLCECGQKARAEAEKRAKEKKHREKIEYARFSGFPDKEMSKWDFKIDDNPDSKISKTARRYVDNFETMIERGKGLLFFGSVGTGKTFTSACIVNELIDRGYPCLMTSFPRIANTLQGMYDGRQQFIDSLNDYKLLVIDDMATERNTEYMAEIVQMIIDSRYRAGLPLIITTNLTAEELKNPANIKQQRTYSRLFEMCFFVEVNGKDRRREKLIEETAEYSRMLELNPKPDKLECKPSYDLNAFTEKQINGEIKYEKRK